VVDSSELKNNEFIMKGNVAFPEIYYITTPDKNSYIQLFLENSEIKISASIDSLEKAIIKGSVSQDQYSSFLEDYSVYENKQKDLFGQYLEADAEGDQKIIKQIDSTYKGLLNEQIKFLKKYVFENNNSVVAVYVALNKVSNLIDLNTLDSMTLNMNQTLSNSSYYKELKSKVSILKSVQIGMQAPNFIINDTAGIPVNLASLKGKYILIDFWAAWCKPCRNENPELVKIFEKFKTKDFLIVGVSFDNVRKDWLKAIKDDKLTWIQLSDLKGWKSEAGRLYGVNSIPHSVLINKDGVIIEKNLHGEKLEKKLVEILKK